MWIFSPNLEKWIKIRSGTFSRSLILSSKNYPSSTFSMHNILKRFPELKNSGLWQKLWMENRGELLCLENVNFWAHSISILFLTSRPKTMMRTKKRTGPMLYPCFTSTLKGIEVTIFPIISLTTIVCTFFWSQNKSREDIHIWIGWQSGVCDLVSWKLLLALQNQPRWVSCGCYVGSIWASYFERGEKLVFNSMCLHNLECTPT